MTHANIKCLSHGLLIHLTLIRCLLRSSPESCERVCGVRVQPQVWYFVQPFSELTHHRGAPCIQELKSRGACKIRSEEPFAPSVKRLLKTRKSICLHSSHDFGVFEGSPAKITIPPRITLKKQDTPSEKQIQTNPNPTTPTQPEPLSDFLLFFEDFRGCTLLLAFNCSTTTAVRFKSSCHTCC